VREELVLGLLGLVALLLPIATALALAVPLLLGWRLDERVIDRTVRATFLACFLACLGVDAMVFTRMERTVDVTLARWLVVPQYALEARLVFDPPAAVLMTLTALLCGLIGVFSAPYLHRDPGYRRFFVLLPLFAAGMMAIAAGGTLDLVYAGWEVVGLSSALLIAYFHEREAPVRHGLRVFAVYRVCDAALLSAVVLLHGHGDPRLIALLLVLASLGKAAAFPFTGWLPRAMEGPTPSSAVFYGALSIHAGPFLLIRCWPLLEGQSAVRGLLVGVGLLTAAHASMVGRVQTDIKSALGYASAAQAGLILAEIGFGLPQLALAHLTGHAVLRTWQLLRAPSLIDDRHEVGRAVGGRPAGWFGAIPSPLQRMAYRFALERWFVDDLAASALLDGTRTALRAIDRLDRWWTRVLLRGDGGESP
jgi:NADH-quinone oxidoreductase subunit L